MDRYPQGEAKADKKKVLTSNPSEARKRQIEAGKNFAKGHPKVQVNLPEAMKGQAREKNGVEP